MKGSNTTVSLFTEVSLRIKSRLQHTLPLPFSQCQALSFVSENHRASMQDVARHFKITAPSATFLIEELVRGGYLMRRSNTRDRRKIELALTAKGRGVAKNIVVKRERVLRGVFGSLPKSDQSDLNRILGKIVEIA